jgi:Tol biopolymer transport system component
MLAPVEGGAPHAFLSTQFDEQQGAFSPDGKWVAYQSNESGPFEVYVRPFPGPGGVWQISAGGGASPRWARDGKELYYIAPGGRMMAVAIGNTAAKIAAGRPVPLFTAHSLVVVPNRPQYDVTRDGRFLLSTEAAANSAPITLLQNWRPPK